MVSLDPSVGNDEIEVADAIRNTCDAGWSTRVVEAIDLDDKERAFGSVREL